MQIVSNKKYIFNRKSFLDYGLDYWDYFWYSQIMDY